MNVRTVWYVQVIIVNLYVMPLYCTEEASYIFVRPQKICLVRLYTYAKNVLDFYETWFKGSFGEGDYKSTVKYGGNYMIKFSQFMYHS